MRTKSLTACASVYLCIVLGAAGADPVGELMDMGGPEERSIIDAKSGRYKLIATGPPENTEMPHWVKVAVIDSGIDTNHPQLRHLVVKQKDFTGEGLQDELGHGTRVAL